MATTPEITIAVADANMESAIVSARCIVEALTSRVGGYISIFEKMAYEESLKLLTFQVCEYTKEVFKKAEGRQ